MCPVHENEIGITHTHTCISRRTRTRFRERVSGAAADTAAACSSTSRYPRACVISRRRPLPTAVNRTRLFYYYYYYYYGVWYTLAHIYKRKRTVSHTLARGRQRSRQHMSVREYVIQSAPKNTTTVQPRARSMLSFLFPLGRAFDRAVYVRGGGGGTVYNL